MRVGVLDREHGGRCRLIPDRPDAQQQGEVLNVHWRWGGPGDHRDSALDLDFLAYRTRLGSRDAHGSYPSGPDDTVVWPASAFSGKRCPIGRRG